MCVVAGCPSKRQALGHDEARERAAAKKHAPSVHPSLVAFVCNAVLVLQRWEHHDEDKDTLLTTLLLTSYTYLLHCFTNHTGSKASHNSISDWLPYHTRPQPQMGKKKGTEDVPVMEDPRFSSMHSAPVRVFVHKSSLQPSLPSPVEGYLPTPSPPSTYPPSVLPPPPPSPLPDVPTHPKGRAQI